MSAQKWRTQGSSEVLRDREVYITEASPRGEDAMTEVSAGLLLSKLIQELEVGLALGCTSWNEVVNRVG